VAPGGPGPAGDEPGHEHAHPRYRDGHGGPAGLAGSRLVSRVATRPHGRPADVCHRLHQGEDC